MTLIPKILWMLCQVWIKNKCSHVQMKQAHILISYIQAWNSLKTFARTCLILHPIIMQSPLTNCVSCDLHVSRLISRICLVCIRVCKYTAAWHCVCYTGTVLYSIMKIAMFLFVSQVTANALPVRWTRECWRICQHLMDRQFLRVLIPPVVSAQSRDTHFCSLPGAATLHTHTHTHTETDRLSCIYAVVIR